MMLCCCRSHSVLIITDDLLLPTFFRLLILLLSSLHIYFIIFFSPLFDIALIVAWASIEFVEGFPSMIRREGSKVEPPSSSFQFVSPSLRPPRLPDSPLVSSYFHFIHIIAVWPSATPFKPLVRSPLSVPQVPILDFSFFFVNESSTSSSS